MAGLNKLHGRKHTLLVKMMQSRKYFPHASKMTNFAYNWVKNVIMNNAITLHNVFNFRDVEVMHNSSSIKKFNNREV